MAPPGPAPDLAAIRAGTPAVYRAHAADWDARRPRMLFEAPWLDRLAAAMPPGPLLDLGCGAGDPIARRFLEAGRAVLGLDAAPEMLALARARLPQGRWILGDMRHLDRPERFAGILSWDASFHLTPAEHRALLPRLARHLRPGGALLLTVGPRAGETAGHVAGKPVYHSSLDPAELRARLLALGFARVEVAVEDPACDGHSLAFAEGFAP